MLLENFMFQKLLRLVSHAGWLTPSFESFPQLCLLFSPPLHHHKMFKYEWLITKRWVRIQPKTHVILLDSTCHGTLQDISFTALWVKFGDISVVTKDLIEKRLKDKTHFSNKLGEQLRKEQAAAAAALRLFRREASLLSE